MDPNYHIDSTINTLGENNLEFKRGGVNFNGKHQINKSSDLSFDLDYVKFSITNDQNYQTQLLAPGSIVSATRGNTPSKLDIVTLKVDYSKRYQNISS